jgi:hypothetical protein
MRVNPKSCDEMLDALKAVAAEITEGVQPYSTDSYLPPHIRDIVFAAIAAAENA